MRDSEVWTSKKIFDKVFGISQSHYVFYLKKNIKQKHIPSI